MPRGRPRKNPLPSPVTNTLSTPSAPINKENVEENENEESTLTLSTKGRKPIPKSYPICTRCGKEIETTPFRINLSYLTSVASYYREVKDDVPSLCNECAKGLSKAVDDYLLNGGAKRKFEGVGEMDNVDKVNKVKG